MPCTELYKQRARPTNEWTRTDARTVVKAINRKHTHMTIERDMPTNEGGGHKAGRPTSEDEVV